MFLHGHNEYVYSHGEALAFEPLLVSKIQPVISPKTRSIVAVATVTQVCGLLTHMCYMYMYFLCVHTCVLVHVIMYACACLCTCICVCMYVCMYVCVYVCMYVYVFIIHYV